MYWGKRKGEHEKRGFLMSLLHDVRGNTLIIMTAALIPLAGMVGGGIDISRMYILKTRMQHACDAGALAGRKTMGGGTWGYNSYAARTQAEKFFEGNIEAEPFGSSGLTKTFTENAGRVTGTASATIPMTLMRIFGKTTETISVTCASEMRLPNTDVMFVLDTTGSMALLQPGDSVSKMDALKTAVKCFYEIVARLDTDANCTTGAPSGGTGDQVQIRFGFVPYSTNVNVGRLLPTSYFADSWKYQSREPRWNDNGNSWVQQGSPQTTMTALAPQNISQDGCSQANADAFAAANPGMHNYDAYSNNNTTKTNTRVTYSIAKWEAGNKCYVNEYHTVTTSTWQPNQTFRDWYYGQIPTNIAGLKNGASWNAGVSLPIGPNGTSRVVNWDGCIEERPTVPQTSYTPIPANAKDLNIDLLPTQNDASTLWGPALPGAIYARDRTTSWSQLDPNPTYSTADFSQAVNYFCPREARLLESWPIADDFDDYVNGLFPTGNTYHDIGMLWGARLMSPDGIFAASNKVTSKGGDIERHMIFMTDGDSVSQPCDYTAYGFLYLDKRTTTNVGSASNCNNYDGGRQELNDQIDARLVALCAAVKNKNITLWVIAFGDLATDTETRLSNCATSGRYFKATNAATLQSTFKSIADQISQLRLTR